MTDDQKVSKSITINQYPLYNPTEHKYPLNSHTINEYPSGNPISLDYSYYGDAVYNELLRDFSDIEALINSEEVIESDKVSDNKKNQQDGDVLNDPLKWTKNENIENVIPMFTIKPKNVKKMYMGKNEEIFLADAYKRPIARSFGFQPWKKYGTQIKKTKQLLHSTPQYRFDRFVGGNGMFTI